MSPIQVTYFQPNDVELVALVEGLIPVRDGDHILMELVATRGKDGMLYLSLEDIGSGANPPE